MFKLFEPTRFELQAPRWARKVPKYPLTFGFSAFAHLFICSEDKTTLAVVVTERLEFVELNISSIEVFTDTFLKNAKVLSDFFHCERYGLLVDRLGTPSDAECFFPVPYPVNGGSGALDTYQKGNIWVHLDLYGQMMGL